MHLSTHILGGNVAHAIAERAGAPLLRIGSDTFRRSHLSSVGCFNFVAAQRLSAACAVLGVKSTRDLFDRFPPSALVLPGVGAVALAVLGAAFEAKRIGGERPLEAWMTAHRPKDASREYVTFHTMKVHEKERERGETRAKKARAARKHARRDTAQQLRVDRFTTRQSREKAHAQ